MTAARNAAAAAAVLILVGAAGCSPGAGGAEQTATPSPPAQDQVTIAAPPTVDSTEVQLNVTGPLGSQVDIYAYSSEWSLSAPACTSTDDPIRSVDLSSSPATVKVSVASPGVWWWVAASTADGGVTTKCGAVSTLARAKPDVALAGPRPIDGLNGYSANVPAGKPFRFYVVTDTPAPKPLSGAAWPVEAVWVGPFSSAPEARSAPCESTEAALRAKGQAVPDKPAELSVTPTKPGVYRVVATASESRWNVADSTGCDDSTPYLVVK